MNTIKVVIMDDDELMGMMLTDNLQDFGFEAIHVLRTTQMPMFHDGGKADVIVMDVHMPRQSGISVAGNLHSIGYQDIPIIFISSDDSEKNIAKTEGIDNSMFLSKQDLTSLPSEILRMLGVSI